MARLAVKRLILTSTPNEGMKRLPNKLWAGFTLIEMLAAFVLLALMAAVALPNMQRWYEGTTGRVEHTQIAQQVQQLLVRGAVLGQEFELTRQSTALKLSDGQPALVLPAGWALVGDSSLRVRRTGLCTKAELVFEKIAAAAGAQRLDQATLDVTADSCEVRLRRPA
jgi:prepilin-type N-terminal cleavage/methylation domain-containing protein